MKCVCRSEQKENNSARRSGVGTEDAAPSAWHMHTSPQPASEQARRPEAEPPTQGPQRKAGPRSALCSQWPGLPLLPGPETGGQEGQVLDRVQLKCQRLGHRPLTASPSDSTLPTPPAPPAASAVYVQGEAASLGAETRQMQTPGFSPRFHSWPRSQGLGSP